MSSSASVAPSPVLMTVNGNEQRPIQTWHDVLFAKVRTLGGVASDFLADLFDSDFKSGGGKGGDLMAFTRNRQFIVKELNSGDHESLLRITEHYVNHVTTGPTLLALFFLHYLDVTSGKKFVVMGNCLETSPSFGPPEKIFDLKGCADDKMLFDGHKIEAVHKRVWDVHLWLGHTFWSDAREDYWKHKCEAHNWSVSLPNDIQMLISEAIRRDCAEFLIPEGLMDYSLLVATQVFDGPELRALMCGDHAPYAEADEEQLLAVMRETYAKPKTSLQHWRSPFLFPTQIGDKTKIECMALGIIDFLQVWNASKVVASAVKVLEHDKATIPPKAYGERFMLKFGLEKIRGNGKFLAHIGAVAKVAVRTQRAVQRTRRAVKLTRKSLVHRVRRTMPLKPKKAILNKIRKNFVKLGAQACKNTLKRSTRHISNDPL